MTHEDEISRVSRGSKHFQPRLETRTHCKAFLMTEEILSYTHPFRTPRCRGNVLSGECEAKDRDGGGSLTGSGNVSLALNSSSCTQVSTRGWGKTR